MRSPDAEEPAMRALAEAGIEGLSPSEIDILLGDGPNVRFLKRLPEYGKASVFSASYAEDPEAKSPRDCFRNLENPHWDDRLFADRCAGCHATGIDTQTASMSTPSLECYVCHGLTEIEHTTPEATALLSGSQPTDARVELSICGQCHLRGGRSRATGRPYPTNFVPGDNLLRDFQVDFDEAAVSAMDPVERHIFVNARDVLLRNQSELTCTSCHSIHENNSEKHGELDEVAYCAICHKPGKAMSDAALPKRRSSKTCGY
jgi:hypothetical protein